MRENLDITSTLTLPYSNNFEMCMLALRKEIHFIYNFHSSLDNDGGARAVTDMPLKAYIGTCLRDICCYSCG